MNQYLDILAIIGLIIFIFRAFKDIEEALLIGILIKSLIDGAWDVKFAGFSLIDLHSIIFILFSLQLIFKNNLIALIDTKLNVLWIVAHIGILMLSISNPMGGIDAFARMLFFPISLALVPYFLFYCGEDVATRLIKYMIYASLLSGITSILQFVGVIPHEFEHLTKGLSRSNGFFHDMVTSRIYVMQGLIVLAYIRFSERYSLSSFKSWVLLSIFVVAGYTLYSKALIGIFAFAGILLIFTTKQKVAQLIIGFSVAFLIVISNSQILESTTQLFVKEISYNDGELDDSGQLFSGRGMLWQDYLKMFDESSSIEKVIGLGMNDGRAHNEFLRILILSGFVGLIAYAFLIISIISKAFSQLMSRSSIVFISLFCSSILVIDSVSVVWGMYPFYMVTIVGFLQATFIQDKLITDESIDTKIRLW